MKIFNFDKSDITRYIEHELKTLEKFKEPLNFVINCLVKQKKCINIQSLDKDLKLNKVKEREGKSYNWSVFTYNNITLVVRRYGHHLTIFTKVDKGGVDFMDRPNIDYGAFTLHTNMEQFGEKHDKMLDVYYENPFTDLTVIIKDLFTLLSERSSGVAFVWNSASLKRPKHVELKLIFSGNTISSLDLFVFCMEELENTYQELFSETIMVQRLKELKTGEKLGKIYEVGEITSTIAEDDYYHNVGVELLDIRNRKKKDFKDVYSLTRYYAEDILTTKLYSFKGVFYVEGGQFKEGEPVAYKKSEDNDVSIFKKSYPKENFVPLKKYKFVTPLK